jgi:hypothetical protein
MKLNSPLFYSLILFFFPALLVYTIHSKREKRHCKCLFFFNRTKLFTK